MAGIELARLAQQLRRQGGAVHFDARRDAVGDVLHVDGQGRDASPQLVVELGRGVARRLKRGRLAGLLGNAGHAQRGVARLDQQAHRDLRLRELDARGRHVHQRIGGCERLHRALQVALVAIRAALVHQAARGLLVGCGRIGVSHGGAGQGTGDKRSDYEPRSHRLPFSWAWAREAWVRGTARGPAAEPRPRGAASSAAGAEAWARPWGARSPR